MIEFDSTEYWLETTWDRYSELDTVPLPVREEWLRQERLTAEAVAEHATGIDRPRILDVACGTGRLAAAALDALGRPADLTMWDLNPETLRKTREYLADREGIEYVQGDAYEVHTRFPGTVDIVMCMDFLHHVSDLPRLLAGIRGSLRPGGHLVSNAFVDRRFEEYDVLKYGHVKSTLRKLGRKVGPTLHRIAPGPMGAWIRRVGMARIDALDVSDLEAHLSSAGFSIRRCEQGYYYWFVAEAV